MKVFAYPFRSAATVLALACATTSASAMTAAEVYARLAPSVWVVRTFDADGLPLGLGSAVVIGTQTLITNCHVLRKAKRVELTHEKTTAPATLELWDTARDLCQLKAPAVDAPAVPFGDEAALVVGQPVYALGSPAGLELTLSTGIVSALRRNDAQRLTTIQTSAAISRGSSGGGLFDEQGRLIGVTSAFIGGNAQNLNLVIPIEMVRELPQRHAAAQRAKTAAQDAAAPAVAAAPSTSLAALSGNWFGEYRCGAYSGPGKVEHPGPWAVAASMTVTPAGGVSMVRTDMTITEVSDGEIGANLSVDLKGRGSFKAQPNGSYWLTRVAGQFSADAPTPRFSGRGQMTTSAGELTRECSVAMTKR